MIVLWRMNKVIKYQLLIYLIHVAWYVASVICEFMVCQLKKVRYMLLYVHVVFSTAVVILSSKSVCLSHKSEYKQPSFSLTLLLFCGIEGLGRRVDKRSYQTFQNNRQGNLKLLFFISGKSNLLHPDACK